MYMMGGFKNEKERETTKKVCDEIELSCRGD
jgi:hypothetical protein